MVAPFINSLVIFVVCSQTFALFWLRKTAVPVKIFWLSFCVFANDLFNLFCVYLWNFFLSPLIFEIFICSMASTSSRCSSPTSNVPPITVPGGSPKHSTLLSKILTWQLVPQRLYNEVPVAPSLVYGAIHLMRLFGEYSSTHFLKTKNILSTFSTAHPLFSKIDIMSLSLLFFNAC